MAGAYPLALLAHSYTRWLVLASATLFVIITGVRSLKSESYTRFEDRLHRAFTGVLDLQALLGIVLYVLLSPISRAFLASPRVAIHVSQLRFFGLEHVIAMLTAVGVVHVGRALSKKTVDPRGKRRVLFWSAFVGLLVMWVAVPWPHSRASRPLFRSVNAAVSSALSENQAADRSCPATYGRRCAPCHGSNGRGDGVLAASLATKPRDFGDPGWSDSRSDRTLANVIRAGGAAAGLSPLMPAHADLSSRDLAGLVSCVRSFTTRGK